MAPTPLTLSDIKDDFSCLKSFYEMFKFEWESVLCRGMTPKGA